MRKCVCGMALALVLLVPLAASAQDRPGLRMGILPVIDTLPLIVAQEKGLFAEEGLDLELISFTSALERDAALTSGRIDGFFADLVITLLLNAQGQDLKVLTEAYHTCEQQPMFAVLSAPNSSIRTLAEIGDTPVAVSSASIIEYFLDAILARGGLAPASVRRLEVKAIPIRLQMLMQGTIELALLPDPLATKAVTGGAHVVADDRGLDTTATILAVKGSFLKQHPGAYARFLKAYRRSVALINAHPEDYLNLLAERTRFPRELKATYRLPPFPAPGPPAPAAVVAVETWLYDKGLVPSTGTYARLIGKE